MALRIFPVVVCFSPELGTLAAITGASMAMRCSHCGAGDGAQLSILHYPDANSNSASASGSCSKHRHIEYNNRRE